MNSDERYRGDSVRPAGFFRSLWSKTSRPGFAIWFSIVLSLLLTFLFKSFFFFLIIPLFTLKSLGNSIKNKFGNKE